MLVATHHGSFHADDVLAWALIRVFLDPQAELIRTRDEEVIQSADVVIDVGGIFDPDSGRFDHHQQSYTGPLSAAGMVLNWLQGQGHIPTVLAERLRHGMVEYIDDVDNGRVRPSTQVPCFPRIVDTFNQGRSSLKDFDRGFDAAAQVAVELLEGYVRGHAALQRNERLVTEAMAVAVAAGTNLMELDRSIAWKDLYFAHGGAEHPTEFLLHPGVDDSWRVVAIPPSRESFDKKVPLPQAWAGLKDEELEEVTGVKGAVFCHKNSFIAVFRTRDAALRAISAADLIRSTRDPKTRKSG